ncbi:hypothetical protein JQ620_09240 [Bradyrhizobium sp. AUGA SZCCT0274]|uniref:hypothetical protein n=1 Tax=Bradyrhizobium sp. AUGA SZCCT0274 TaxID=2807670 RepID=UPI001BAD423F|nr:hypothetical protein [Bradyrhizobium sp. AUGA SZCCT0274]MBR1240308.1 hypothetical protein [Bradyrhizobium sp. AUGA SZCCT0274]
MRKTIDTSKSPLLHETILRTSAREISEGAQFKEAPIFKEAPVFKEAPEFKEAPQFKEAPANSPSMQALRFSETPSENSAEPAGRILARYQELIHSLQKPNGSEQG